MPSSAHIKKKVALPSGKMVSKETAIYHRRKARLMAEMGGVCVKCGTDRRLEFDHIIGIGWDASAIAARRRVARYRKDWKASLLQVLCGPCNKAKGRPKKPAVDEAEPF